MTDIDRILQAEKTQHHRLDNPDLMAFAILTQIAHEEAQAHNRRRFRLGIFVCLLISLLAIQAFAFSSLSFVQLSQSLGDLIARYPIYVMVINSSLAVAILAFRRKRVF